MHRIAKAEKMGQSPRKSKNSVPPKGPRRNKGFRQAGAPMRGTLQTIAGRQGFAESDVLLRWPEIVGPQLSTVCRPVKVSYGGDRSIGATLIVQTDSGRAPEVEHQQQLFVDRVNQFYGYRAIRRLRVTQSTGFGRTGGFAQAGTRPAGFAEGQAAFTPASSEPNTEPNAADQQRADAMTAEITSPNLRAALARMGAHVLAQGRASKR